MLFRRKPSTILVEFVDADTGKPFAHSRVPPDQLPETSALETTMHLGEEPWFVVSADPMTSEEFRKSGRLRLTLRKVTMIDPADLLFSLPTIDDSLPPPRQASADEADRLFIMHEDDWRQREFVHMDQQAQIEECLAAIRRIYAEFAESIGFRKLHVRREVPAPLEGALVSCAEVESLFGPGQELHSGLSFSPGALLVAENSFAVRSRTLLLYGVHVESAVLVLGFDVGDSQPSEDDILALARFARAHGLCLVDWCRAEQVEADEEPFRAYFESLS